ncbi:MAG: DUF2889 domain-containing protein [Steroidobacteraceae bacterium]
MPLPPEDPRELLGGRRIECRGYSRADGLIEVEGQLVDTKGHEHAYGWRDPVPAGSPIHDMRVRIAFDEQLVIREIHESTDSAPFPICRAIAPNLQRLVGVRIAGGFKKEMRARVGRTDGCTHVVTLIDALADAAVQALASHVRERGKDAVVGVYGVRDPNRPPLIDSCHAYAATSPVVESKWPEYYRGPPG